ncbi:hypothetical protein E3U43_016599 [Larimichthys crocea]|uniref:Uncharacterized protein n=1 Tax=Larimichthys crocea TaxID=215358 RepID=A0ACD3QI10_LARCR|nr:hypothetical protein E3U43_016599 [Larimichthys crocea]
MPKLAEKIIRMASKEKTGDLPCKHRFTLSRYSHRAGGPFCPQNPDPEMPPDDPVLPQCEEDIIGLVV